MFCGVENVVPFGRGYNLKEFKVTSAEDMMCNVGHLLKKWICFAICSQARRGKPELLIAFVFVVLCSWVWAWFYFNGSMGCAKVFLKRWVSGTVLPGWVQDQLLCQSPGGG